MNRFKKLILSAGAIFFLYGCAEVLLVGAGAGLGVASYVYIDGRVVVEYPIAYDRAWDATNRTLEKFRISITDSSNEHGRGVIEAVRKDGKKIMIRVKTKGEKTTDVTVRVGIFGDKLEAQKIHSEIVSVAGI